MPIVAAVPAILGAAGSAVGGILGNSAADAQAGSLQQGLGALSDIYKQSVSDTEPFITNGQGANNQLSYLLGLGDPNRANAGQGQFGSLMQDFDASKFQQDPGYQFRLAEGQKTLEHSAAARGTQLSGGTLKALDRYNQDFASNEYGNAFNRYQSNRGTKYGFLSGLSGQGLNALGMRTQAGGNFGAALPGIYGGIGDARARGAVSTNNAVQGGFSNLADLLALMNLGGKN